MPGCESNEFSFDLKANFFYITTRGEYATTTLFVVTNSISELCFPARVCVQMTSE